MTKSISVAYYRTSDGYRICLLGRDGSQALSDLKACSRGDVLEGTYGDIFGTHAESIHTAMNHVARELRALGYETSIAGFISKPESTHMDKTPREKLVSHLQEIKLHATQAVISALNAECPGLADRLASLSSEADRVLKGIE